MAKWDFIFGDSIGAGIASSQGLKRKLGNRQLSKDSKGTTMVGGRPNEILGWLQEFGAPAFDGKVVILSSGYSNGTTQTETIKKQLQFLKDANAAVMVLGVVGKVAGSAAVQKLNLPKGNATLKKMAEDFGFAFAGPFFNTTDGVHPKSYGDYWNLFHMNIPAANAPKNAAPVPEKKTDDKPPVTNQNVTNEPPKDQSKVEDKPPVVEKRPDPPQEPVKVVPADAFGVVGKVMLKKKSGPGEIVGVVEKDISNIDINRGVEFSGISFTAPGDYVVSVTCDNEYVDNGYIFEVTVLPEEVPEQPGKDVEKPAEGTRPIIAQVDKPRMKMKPIVMDIPPSTDQALSTVTAIGIHPLVMYAGAEINSKDIKFLRLYHDGVLPKCSMMFTDSLGLIKTNLAQDFSTFELFIDSRSPDLKSIHLDFLIESFTQDPRTNVFTMNGTIHIPTGNMLYEQNYKTYSGTSLEALRRICSEMGIGFNTNIDKSDDAMRWVHGGKRTYEVMNEIIKHSYVSEKSFMWGYIDYYYCFNYIDVEKEYGRDNTKDIGVETGVGKNSTTYTPIKFINDGSSNKSTFYFQSFDLKNKATSKSIKTGHKTKVKYYDTKTKEWLVFDIDGNTSDQSEVIPMKGKLQDRNITKSNVATKFMGYIDTTNVHQNYHYAVALNKRNLDELQKVTVSITLPNLNLNVYKGMKVYMTFVNHQPNAVDTDELNWRLTGNWIISDINYLFQDGSFKQTMVCSRRDVGKNPLEMNTPIEKKPAPVEKTENPDDDKYNERYELGRTYKFRDAKGEFYYLTVKTKSDDGKKMVGELKMKVPFYASDDFSVSNFSTSESSLGTNTGNSAPTEKVPVVQETPSVEQNVPAAETSNQVKRRILVVGDSQSAVYTKSVKMASNGDLVTGGTKISYTWPNLLKGKIAESEVDVLAIGGKVTDWMLNGGTDSPGLKKLLSSTPKKYDTVIIYGGGNDASNASITLDTTIANIQKMVDLSIAHGATVYVNMGYKVEGTDGEGGLERSGKAGRGFGNWKYMAPTFYLNKNWPKEPEGGSEGWKQYVQKRKDLQERIKKDVKNAFIVPVYDLKSQTVDCIHPTATGHKDVANFIFQALKGERRYLPNK